MRTCASPWHLCSLRLLPMPARSNQRFLFQRKESRQLRKRMVHPLQRMSLSSPFWSFPTSAFSLISFAKTPVRVSTTSQSLPVISRLPQPYPTISTLQSAFSVTSGEQPAIISAQMAPTSTGKVSTPATRVNVSELAWWGRIECRTTWQRAG